MSRLPQIDPATATGKAADALTDVQRTLGLTPNITKAMANSPTVLKAYLQLRGTLAGGALPAGVRERLAVATAEANGCAYCLSAHLHMGAAIAGIGEEELRLAREGRSADPYTAALLALSAEVAAHRGAVDDSVLARARAAGVTDAEIAEVVAHLALNVFTNYFNNLADPDNDWPVVVTPHTHAPAH